MAMKAKANGALNGGLHDKGETIFRRSFNTLSGLEVADGRSSLENFKLLLSDEKPFSSVSESEMAYKKDFDNVTLMVSVEDTGIGIPFHAQDRVFTPFMQADSSTSRNYGGTGIGLSISKCLVELMGGQISFVSCPNVGSTFTFTAVLQRCQRSAVDETKRTLSESLLIAFKGMNAVLVDRRPVRSSVTVYHLKRLGISVEVVGTVKTALDAFSRQDGHLRSA